MKTECHYGEQTGNTNTQNHIYYCQYNSYKPALWLCLK